MKILLTMTFISFFTSSLQAEKMLLYVDVKKQKFTEYSIPCNNDCITFSNWYIYEAKIHNVVEGSYNKSKIKFAVLQHAKFLKKYVKNVYFIVNELENLETAEKLGTKYYSNGVIHPQEVLCLPKSFIKSTNKSAKFINAPLTSKNNKELCYLTDWLGTE